MATVQLQAGNPLQGLQNILPFIYSYTQAGCRYYLPPAQSIFPHKERREQTGHSKPATQHGEYMHRKNYAIYRFSFAGITTEQTYSTFQPNR